MEKSYFQEVKMGYGDHPDLRGVKKILVIKLRHLGDVLLTGAVFRSLQSLMPGSVIDAYVYKEAIPMLEGHPGVDTLIGYDRRWQKGGFFKRLTEEIRIWRKIRLGQYDLVLNLTEGDRGVFAAWISGAKIRVGFPPKGKWQRKLLTHSVKECHSLRHAVERNLDALRRIGLFPPGDMRTLYLHVPEEARRRVEGLVGSRPFILIHPASRWRYKCWPALKMRQLIERLLHEGQRVVLTTGAEEGEKEMVREIAEGLDVLNLAGAVSLKELGALIERAELLVCVDSVPLHMASALQKPMVALFGPTSDVTWGPWRNPQARIVSMPFSCRPCYLDGCGGSKKSDCLEAIPVDLVLKTIQFLQRALQPKVLSEVGAACLCVGKQFIDGARE
ncbi:MAG: putative lipopolysaccharide heptosyltransferase III [Chlamydiia bacterium]|nr:putative lipopolysaccharide heptosyltransferase III [Chlamydiia bacterium]